MGSKYEKKNSGQNIQNKYSYFGENIQEK